MEIEQYQRHFELAQSHWWYLATNRLFTALVRKHVPPGEKLLDVGCGTGAILSELSKDYRACGLDTAGVALDFCRKRGLEWLVPGTAEQLPFPDATFGAGLLLDVLYHEQVADELQALRELRRVLKTGGHAFLQVPAYEWLRSAHDRKAHTARRYTAGRLRILLAEAGFEVVRLSYRMSSLFPLAVLQRKMLKSEDSDMRPTSPILNSVLGRVATWENAVTQRISLPFGLSVFAVARKHDE